MPDPIASLVGKRVRSITPKAKKLQLTPLTSQQVRKSMVIEFTDGTKLTIRPNSVRQGDYIGSGDDEAHYTDIPVFEVRIR